MSPGTYFDGDRQATFSLGVMLVFIASLLTSFQNSVWFSTSWCSLCLNDVIDNNSTSIGSAECAQGFLSEQAL